ncbi:carbonic anhydrase [Sistotremastrum suecicum HHB10207 ss-3]|uniref:Carbonic anhydrase n=1 Tax=Sistotremastrum suecicum HHB10207 ss-3 TaxID=1314776 RepID=A0A165ZXK9_9AGAM|nr:carbonic anhydrase [Sistotremastrum suecicum HHB10207 ss-3]
MSQSTEQCENCVKPWPPAPGTIPPALQKLLDRNERWSEDIKAIGPKFFYESANRTQQPKVLWIGCSDSRVPEGVVCDVLPGVLFTTRNIANQFKPEDISVQAVLTYAVHLEIEHVVVVGHSKCGGAEAALKYVRGIPQDPLPPALFEWLQPLINLAQKYRFLPTNFDHALNDLIRDNIVQQHDNVLRSKALRNEGVKIKQPITVHCWLYDLEEGVLSEIASRFIGLEGFVE